MNLDLAGRSVLISGASKGIGRAVAEEFAREGCRLFLVSRTATDLERARDEIRTRHNVPVEIYAADLSRLDARQAVVEKAGAIDILINNAGAIPKGDLLELDDARWREAWDLKVFGYINMCREFYRGMQVRKSGVIVNIIGLAAEKPDYDYLAGSTGNASLVAFTRALGSLSIDYGVRVIGVNPGYVETERAVRGLRIRAEKELGDPAKWPDLIRDLWPRGKMITPKEIADVVVFLASDRASAMTGHIVTVDAGFAARSYGRRVNQ
jgi:NAD(P)-dependent dehydrogenase (short-subunit alcohol dehydrogenase family)